MKLIKKTFRHDNGGTLELELLYGDCVLMECNDWRFDNFADIKRLAQEISDMLPQQGELS